MLSIWIGRAGAGKSRRVLETMARQRSQRPQVLLVPDVYKRQSLTCDDAAIPADGSNLAWRAAEVFFRTTGVACDGLHITLEKSIPSQAGLGGGSSDAAAVLRLSLIHI